jgi:hypothetical protein
MNINKLLRQVNEFLALASGEELPEDTSDLKTILKNLDRLETYSARTEYAERNLIHLSSGSSRIVYLTPDETIIKLAKNDKGLAQNKAESNPKMKSLFLNEILSKSKDGVWIETNFLKKITSKEFEEMIGIPFKDFADSINYGLKNISESKDKKPACFEKFQKLKIYKDIKSVAEEFDLLPGDIARISSWGTRQGKPILIDAGLTKKVYEDFYE